LDCDAYYYVNILDIVRSTLVLKRIWTQKPIRTLKILYKICAKYDIK